MMWRLNFFVFFCCVVMRNDYVLYYICPMHTLFTLFVYFALLAKKEDNDKTPVVLGKFLACAALCFVLWEVPGVFGLYAEGAWRRLTIDPDRVPDDPVGRLDINLLERYCLTPLLGITDQRTDSRIDFVGGIRGVGELQRRVDSGEFVAAFSLFRTSLEDVLAVADAGEVMPPKSTWFEPKLRDGLIVLPLED